VFLLTIIYNSIRVTAVYFKETRNRRNYIIQLISNNSNINKIVFRFKLIIKILK